MNLLNIFSIKNKLKKQIDKNGTISWLQYGQYHHDKEPARQFKDGKKEWWLNGKRHRENAPAVEYPDNSFAWYYHGVLHREDGPAVVYTTGEKMWWLNGIQYSENTFLNHRLKNILSVCQKTPQRKI